MSVYQVMQNMQFTLDRILAHPHYQLCLLIHFHTTVTSIECLVTIQPEYLQTLGSKPVFAWSFLPQ